MGRPFYSTGASFTTLQSFRNKAYGINGAVLAATGIADHAAFCTAIEDKLSEAYISPDAAAAPAPTTYLGGEARVHVAGIATPQIALAFAGPSGSVMGAILKEVLTLSGASSFAGDGLVGVYGSDVDAMSTMVTNKPTADVIKRATFLAKSKTLFGFEAGSASLASAMTAQILETGSFDASGAAFDKVTAKDVSAAYDAMLASGVTMASVGDLSAVPYHGTVATRFS
jgi:hypothetical protein